MKSKNLTLFLMAIVAGATVLGSFTQPTVVHQVAVWSGGLFSLVLIGLVFLVRNWPETATKPEPQQTIVNHEPLSKPLPELSGRYLLQIRHLRDLGWTDKGISDATGYTIEQVRAVR